MASHHNGAVTPTNPSSNETSSADEHDAVYLPETDDIIQFDYDATERVLEDLREGFNRIDNRLDDIDTDCRLARVAAVETRDELRAMRQDIFKLKVLAMVIWVFTNVVLPILRYFLEPRA
ncbi:hypothetical protein F5Y18DRAFT_424446 [Xylariaceae sp. FL1019]|nr:hypothetical protein F5Y18DRAFT_424446 [Xylariaceae sp. FL1019]